LINQRQASWHLQSAAGKISQSVVSFTALKTHFTFNLPPIGGTIGMGKAGTFPQFTARASKRALHLLL
jgi:hypothetical protein